MLTSGRNEELFPDLLDPVATAANDNLNTWLLNSRQQSETATDNDEDDSSDDSSLTDYQSEEYEELRMQTSNNESRLFEGYEELPAAESEDDESGSSYPNKKPKSLEDTHSEQKGYHYLNVYGFYKKTTKMGGFGVIVRDHFGKPVGASAYVQPKGVSLYYHVLQGVEAGLALALEREIYDLKLMCNSSTLDIYLRQIFQVADHGLHGTGRTPYQCGACKTCLRCAIPLTDDEFEIMFPLLARIIDKRSEIMCKSRYFFVTGVRSSLNQAAYHLVKQLAKKPLLSAKPKSVTIKPEKFDDMLKLILYEDAFKGVRLYHQQQRVLKKKNQLLVEKVGVDCSAASVRASFGFHLHS
ncbi:hypothetical protein MKW94_010020 [Papaver nudicaule]|uniref:Uncharacterized protein n=1 Tax=Papaver nudicaule TaxID=74823 RepID=A0AA41S736_PAPNU|nr:hypothetical protein [Papaver nudicaule]